MKTRVIPCAYDCSDKKIQALGDLKITYAFTESELIKKMLKDLEDLIILKIGDVESVLRNINSVKCYSNEEVYFIKEVRVLLN